jgi:hypothetical protein
LGLSQVASLNKTEPSVFHGPNAGEKPLFKPSLNKEIRPVEHWCWINAVFRADSISVNSAKIIPILRPMDGNSQ